MDCVAFLQWALVRLGFRWAGFAKVRGQVCKRVRRRMRDLGLDDFGAYRAYLDANDGEWACLDSLCRVTISRFYRDRRVFDDLASVVLPVLVPTAAMAGRPLRAWSAGCASGEEPYSLTLIWYFRLAERWPEVVFDIVATDSDAALLDRARTGCYGAGSVGELPGEWKADGFRRVGDAWCLRDAVKEGVTWQCRDLRATAPDGPFDLVLCRNLAFTYFADDGQRAVASRIAGVLRPGGALVLGAHETLPPGTDIFAPWPGVRHVWRRCGD